ncbi:exopolysaccharide biosynthesis polyprenyl glycosylphosphotransferase [Echinicola vietnamensis]|uniref:Exopolysaccharide biosynthesis polyprenyl glycosylphosphotransferase n=1 Tax=Echinicola vietnamensis (strain DSM 17526 / LMG 23754 / KMM 6221) TaxID=926556 RepID=L0FXW9_ECHVK|nr:exopolysaccharide biosynthesis polyprenyl glycosylphosphotransferase [Echinicola vietnamensis]AGA77586.1 exopolysaccharide biosynthesis polyprenyl glycosylphosphotransferase [Echinicola vietnamensis DSM 17526]
MARRFYKYFPWLFLLGDVLVIALSLLLTNWIVSKIVVINNMNPLLYGLYLLIWVLLAAFRKDYKVGRTTDYFFTLQKLFGTILWFFSIVSVLWIAFQAYHLSRLFLLVDAASMALLLSLYRVGTHIALKQYRSRGGNYRNAVIIGKGGTSYKLAKVFQTRKDFGINFLGYYDEMSSCVETRGNLNDFFAEVKNMELDLIYINERLDLPTIKKIVHYADEHYIKVKVIPGGSLQLEKKLSFSKYGDFFVINVNAIPLDNAFNRVFKRAFDILFSLFITIFVLSWMIPLVGFLIRLESQGPIFFIQLRNGENNRVFKCLKFRSMTPNDYADTHQATKNDPRVTRIGKFLRSSSLDEMPQFLNVLIGDMSIVGPRPHTVPMNETFKTQIEKYNARHKIKPGITGLAQVKGYRGEIIKPYQIRSRVRLDYFYIQNWTMWMDMRIVFRTIREMGLNRENVY